MKCTWVDCNNDADRPQTASDGEVWANLCCTHDAELTDAYPDAHPTEGKQFSPAKMLSSWVKAGGGSKKMAARMMR